MKSPTILLLFLIIISLQSSEWQIVSTTGPEPRYINQLVFAKETVLLFGGKNSSNDGFDDLWEWKAGQWHLLGSGTTKRWDHSYVYMAHLDQVFLFGGRTFEEVGGSKERVDLNDNWIYQNGQWRNLEIGSPKPRSSHSMAYYPDKGQVILFGGRNKEETFGDTWRFDGIIWTKLGISGPTNRYGHSITYDPQSKAIYLFGGFDGRKLLNDLWSFDGEKWTEITTETKPSARMAHAMQFDRAGHAVLFGGWDDSNAVSGDLWIWDNGQWQKHNTGKMPEARLSGAIGYDPIQDEFLLFGGSTGFDGEFLRETWKLKLDFD